jgi:hypothetical protein
MMNWKGFGTKRSSPNVKVLSRPSPGGTEGNYKIPQDSPSPGPRFEPWTYRILRSVNHSTTTFGLYGLGLVSNRDGLLTGRHSNSSTGKCSYVGDGELTKAQFPMFSPTAHSVRWNVTDASTTGICPLCSETKWTLDRLIPIRTIEKIKWYLTSICQL